MRKKVDRLHPSEELLSIMTYELRDSSKDDPRFKGSSGAFTEVVKNLISFRRLMDQVGLSLDGLESSAEELASLSGNPIASEEVERVSQEAEEAYAKLLSIGDCDIWDRFLRSIVDKDGNPSKELER